MSPAITLTTDFGNHDAYVASVKGVILSINQKATIIDISHSINTYDTGQAAYIISTAYHCFPVDTIHVVIVDPGVGSQRKAIILKTPAAVFIAPDNGVLSNIIDELATSLSQPQYAKMAKLHLKQAPKNAQVIEITNEKYWRHPVSSTFHGRDIFAPVAAHLSLGTPIQEFGEIVNSLNVFPIPQPYFDQKGNLIGSILHIDHFGNLITNISERNLPQGKITITVGNHEISGVSRYYSKSKQLVAIINSNYHLEIALKEGSAARLLGGKVGDRIKVSGP